MRSHHQAILSLECDMVACKHLCQVHLHWYIVTMLKASFDTIRQCSVACTIASIATGIDVVIHCICAKSDFCVATLDAVLGGRPRRLVMPDEPSQSSTVICSSDDATVSYVNKAIITSLPHPPYFLLGCGTIT